MASPSDGSLSSGGLDQGSDAPTRDYEREVSDGIKRRKSKHVDKDEEVNYVRGLGGVRISSQRRPIKHQNRLPSEVREPPPLEVYKGHVDVAHGYVV